jgi:CO dehydrogenase maturation factor
MVRIQKRQKGISISVEKRGIDSMKTLMTAGKGGTGKTTILYHLLQRHILDRPEWTLIVDADPHQSLTYLLGVRDAHTLGQLRHKQNAALRTGDGLDEATSRREFALQLTMNTLHPLAPKADLLVMGRNDQPGCQCVVNGLLGEALDALAGRYDLVIVDNEAGIEHIGRHGWAVDVALLTTSLHTMEMDVAQRIMQHAAETNRLVRHWGIIATPTLNVGWQEKLGSLSSAQQTVLLGSLPFFDGWPSHGWFEALGVIWESIVSLLDG